MQIRVTSLRSVRLLSLTIALVISSVATIAGPSQASALKVMLCFQSSTHVGISGLHVSWDPDGDIDGFDDVVTTSKGCFKKAQVVPDDTAIIYADGTASKPIGVSGQTLNTVEIQWDPEAMVNYPPDKKGVRNIVFTLAGPPAYSTEKVRAVMLDGTPIPNAAIHLSDGADGQYIEQDSSGPGKKDARFIDTDELFQTQQEGTDPSITESWTNLDGTKCTGFDVQEDLDDGGTIPPATVCKAASTLTGDDGSYSLRYYNDALYSLLPRATFNLSLVGFGSTTSIDGNYTVEGNGSTDVVFPNLPRITGLPVGAVRVGANVPYVLTVTALGGGTLQLANGSPIVGKKLTLSSSLKMKSSKTCKPTTKPVTTDSSGHAAFTLCIAKATNFHITGPGLVPSAGLSLNLN